SAQATARPGPPRRSPRAQPDADGRADDLTIVAGFLAPGPRFRISYRSVVASHDPPAALVLVPARCTGRNHDGEERQRGRATEALGPLARLWSCDLVDDLLLVERRVIARVERRDGARVRVAAARVNAEVVADERARATDADLMR